jgi:polyisoprenoid-binding protein YceI
MRKLIFAFAAAGAATLTFGVLHAQQGPTPAAPTADVSKVTAGTYKTDPNHTQILYRYKHLGFTQNMGLLSGATGTLTLDPKNAANDKISVDVPINTIHTTIAALDKELLGPMFFDTDKYPTAHFESTGVTVSGKTAKIAGNFTIHGVTKPGVINATLEAVGANPMSKKDTIAFSGHATLKRSDFGVKQFVPMVGDEVELTITTALEKQ